MPETPRMTIDELKRRIDSGEKFTIIDVRNPHAWAESNVMMPGAIHLPIEEIDKHISQIPKNRPIVAYCT